MVDVQYLCESVRGLCGGLCGSVRFNLMLGLFAEMSQTVPGMDGLQTQSLVEEPTTAATLPATLLSLPHELLRHVLAVAWSPVEPSAAVAFACICGHMRTALGPGLVAELRSAVLVNEVGELADWGSLVIGPPWHMIPGAAGRAALQSYARHLIFSTSSPVEAVALAFTRHWHLAHPRVLVRVVGGGGRFTLDAALEDNLTRGLAAVSKNRCWLISDGLGGNGGDGVAALVGRVRELSDCPGLRRGTARKPVLIGVSPLERLLCQQQLSGRSRGVNLVLDQSRRSRDQPGLPTAACAHLERHHTHFALVSGQGAEGLFERALPVLRRTVGEPPVVFVLIHGGAEALALMVAHLERGWPAVVVAGSGGAADCIEASLRGVERGDGSLPSPQQHLLASVCAQRHRHLLVVAAPGAGGIDTEPAIWEAALKCAAIHEPHGLGTL